VPKYRFVIDFPKEASAIAFAGYCSDDNQARMLARGVIVDRNGHAEVWVGSRFVGVVDAAADPGQAPAPLTTVEEWREAAGTPHCAFVPDSLAVRARKRLKAFGRDNWLLIVGASAAFAAQLLMRGQ
jgi:hypothetical protein